MNNHPLSNLISDQELLEKIANEHGTPLYVYSEERLNENINRLSSAIGNSFEKHHIYYAVKANSNTHISNVGHRSFSEKRPGLCQAGIF